MATALDLEWGDFWLNDSIYEAGEYGAKISSISTQMVQFWWGNCVSHMQNGGELASQILISLVLGTVEFSAYQLFQGMQTT